MTCLDDRFLWAQANLESIQSSKVIVWEDPAFQHLPCKITAISPQWLACAMHGDILPPIEAYHETEFEVEQVGGRIWSGVTRLEFDDMLFEFAKDGKAIKKIRLTKLPFQDETIGVMSEDESIDYLILKDLPGRVWSASNDQNYKNYRIVERDKMPEDDAHRNYWKLSQSGKPIVNSKDA